MKYIIISCFALSFCIMGNVYGEQNSVTCPESHDYQTFVPYPVDCTKFYICVHSEPTEMSCPQGLWFDSESNVCEYPEKAKCGGK